MKYQNQTFTMPVNTSKITELEYALRVGNITQSEYDEALIIAETAKELAKRRDNNYLTELVRVAEHQPTEGFQSESSGNSSPTA